MLKIFGHLKDIPIITMMLHGHGEISFSDNINRIDDFYFEVEKEFKDISILEIGSSMGQGYNFLKSKRKYRYFKLCRN